MSFAGKNIWITGASSGIGEALAYAFSNEGANIVISARNISELERVKARCSSPEKIHIVPIDIADHHQVFEAGRIVLEKLGTLDILVNNAGISQRSLVIDTDFKVDQRIVNTNLLGTVAVSKSVLPSMITRRSGYIVVVSSVVGKIGTPFRSAYSASKHGLHGFFDSARAELFQHNIRVLVVCPGFVKTNVSINALTADGTIQRKMDEATNNGLAADYVASEILNAIAKQKEEVLISGMKEWVAVYLKRFFPGLFSRRIRRMKVT